MERIHVNSQQENVFGKIRGRFDVEFAHMQAKALPEFALDRVRALSPEQIEEFTRLFNSAFKKRMQIVPVGTGGVT